MLQVLRRGCSLEDAIDLLSSGIYGEASPEPSPSGSVPHPSPIPAELNNRNFLSGISYGSVYVPPGPQLPAASVQPPCSSLGNMGLPTGGASAGTSQQLAALRQVTMCCHFLKSYDSSRMLIYMMCSMRQAELSGAFHLLSAAAPLFLGQ